MVDSDLLGIRKLSAKIGADKNEPKSQKTQCPSDSAPLCSASRERSRVQRRCAEIEHPMHGPYSLRFALSVAPISRTTDSHGNRTQKSEQNCEIGSGLII